MTFLAKQFERQARQRARAELRQNHAAWKEYKRRRRNWRRQIEQRLRLLLPSVWIMALYLMLLVRPQFRQRAGVAIAIYATATALLRTNHVLQNTLGGVDRAVMCTLPLDDPGFAEFMHRKLWLSWFGAFLIFAAAYTSTAWDTAPLASIAAPVLLGALLQSICGYCLGVWATVYLPRVTQLILPLYVLLIACLWIPARFVDAIGAVFMMLPSGWITQSFAWATLNGPVQDRLWLIPSIALALSAPFAARALHRRLLEALRSQVDLFLPAQQGKRKLVASALQQPGRSVARVEAPTWEGFGWVECLVWRNLNAREQLVAELLTGDMVLHWSRGWRNGAIATALTVAFCWVPGIPTGVFIMLTLIAASMGTPLFGGVWGGFARTGTFGQLSPTYAFFPVGYNDITRLVLKANWIRIALWSPLLLVASAAVAQPFATSVSRSVLVGAELVWLAAAFQPVALLIQLSQNSNDTRRRFLYKVQFWLIALMLFGILAVSGIALFAAESIAIKAAMAITLFAASGLCWLSYRRLYNRGRLDLVAAPNT